MLKDTTTLYRVSVFMHPEHGSVIADFQRSFYLIHDEEHPYGPEVRAWLKYRTSPINDGKWLEQHPAIPRTHRIRTAERDYSIVLAPLSFDSAQVSAIDLAYAFVTLNKDVDSILLSEVLEHYIDSSDWDMASDLLDEVRRASGN